MKALYYIRQIGVLDFSGPAESSFLSAPVDSLNRIEFELSHHGVDFC
jgi:hypothetical protein